MIYEIHETHYISGRDRGTLKRGTGKRETGKLGTKMQGWKTVAIKHCDKTFPRCSRNVFGSLAYYAIDALKYSSFCF